MILPRLFLASLLAIFLATWAHAITSGAYTDYVYEADYSLPQKPELVELNCSFFHRDGTACNVLEKIPQNARESVTLGMIRRTHPDENQDWVRFWNTRLPISGYYENATIGWLNISDGDYASNGSLQNTWIRLLDIYPSAFKESEGFYYVPNQGLVLGTANVDFVIPNLADGDLCGQEYEIRGYEVLQKSSVAQVSSQNRIMPFSSALNEGEAGNLTYSLEVNGSYLRKIWKWINTTVCQGANCTITQKCELNISDSATDRVSLNVSVPIKRYSDAFAYQNKIAVPQRGFAQGVIDVLLPKDFLFYQVTIKGQTFILRKNEIKIVKRGEIYPVLQINMISAPSRGGTLHVTSLVEEETNTTYRAQIRYKLYIENPDLADSDCHFYVMTPFSLREVENACQTARAMATVRLKSSDAAEGEAIIIANVTDQFSNPIEGLEVEFTGAGGPITKKTDLFGISAIRVEKRESARTVVARIIGSQEYAESSDAIFIAGKGASPKGESQTLSLAVQALPIFLI